MRVFSPFLSPPGTEQSSNVNVQEIKQILVLTQTGNNMTGKLLGRNGHGSENIQGVVTLAECRRYIVIIDLIMLM